MAGISYVEVERLEAARYEAHNRMLAVAELLEEKFRKGGGARRSAANSLGHAALNYAIAARREEDARYRWENRDG